MTDGVIVLAMISQQRALIGNELRTFFIGSGCIEQS